MQDHTELIRQIVEVCLDIKDGENIWIHSWDHTIDLASEIALACRKRGAHPFTTLVTENYWTRSLTEVRKEMLEILPPHQAATLGQTDVFIFMLGPRSPIDWSKIPPEKRELSTIWYLESNKYLDAWRKIAKEQSVRMLGIEYCLVTKDRAQALGLDYGRWRQVMLAGCEVNQREITEKAAQLANLIREGEHVRVQTPFGTNLQFKLAGREPVIGDSIVSREDSAKGVVKFLPSGFVEVAADEDSANGTVIYDVAIPVRGAQKIEGLTLKLKHGKVIEYSARAGVGAFEDYIKSNQGDIDKFGFFGVGLNPGLVHGFTQDDKVSGGVTIGIGGNEDKEGRNRTAGNVHWWASMSRATLQIDRELILRDGAEAFWKPR